MPHFSGPLGVISDVHGNRWALEAVLEDIQRRGVRQVVNLGDSLYGPLAPAATAELLLAHAFPTVSGGHDHTPRAMRLPNGAQVVNPGSVGLQAYRDDQPHPHAMQISSPHARYSIMLLDERGWRAYNYAVRYDWQAAASAALINNRPDWSQWLKTGKA